MIAPDESPALRYVVDEFFDHTGIPRGAPWLSGGRGHDALARIRERLVPLAERIERDWFSPAEEPTGGFLEPWWTRAEHAIAREVRDLAWDAGIPFVQKANWPENHPFAAVITHDIDFLHPTADFASNPVLARIRMALPRGRDAFVRDLLRVAEQDAGLGIHASFYLLEKYPGLPESDLERILHSLEAHGFEVCLHASPACRSDAARLEAERRHLESLGAARILGTRVHLLAFDPAITWKTAAEAGLEYDSSFAWNRASGFRSGSALPFHAFDPSTETVLPLIELPLAYMDWAGLQDGGGHKEMESALRTVTDWVQDVGGVVVVNFHNSYLHRWTHRKSFQAYLGMVRTLQSKGAWLTTGRDCASWWRRRSEAEVAISLRGRTLTIDNPRQLPLAVWAPGSTMPRTVLERKAELTVDTRQPAISS